MKTIHASSPPKNLKSAVIGLLVILGLSGLARLTYRLLHKSPRLKEEADIGEGFGLE